MPASVATILQQRLRPWRPRQRVAYVAWAIALHAAAGLAFAVGQRVTAPKAKPIEYVAVQVVTARALGTAAPAPTPPRPATPPPEPVVRPSTAPALPKPPEKDKKKEPPKPEKEPPPAAAPFAEAAPPGPAAAAPGTAAAVAGPAVAGLDNPSFTYGYYVDQMLGLIQAQWVRPPLGGGIEAMVSFRIQRDGRITDLRIERSSGYSSFDLAGLRAVQSASPLPPLPRSYTQGSLGVNLILR
jgi:protein TonB